MVVVVVVGGVDGEVVFTDNPNTLQSFNFIHQLPS